MASFKHVKPQDQFQKRIINRTILENNGQKNLNDFFLKDHH